MRDKKVWNDTAVPGIRTETCASPCLNQYACSMLHTDSCVSYLSSYPQHAQFGDAVGTQQQGKGTGKGRAREKLKKEELNWVVD